MPEELQQMPTNQVLHDAQTGTGLSHIGFMFGNPISSYDVNSMQNNIMALLGGYISNAGDSASIDIDRNYAVFANNAYPVVRNIKAVISDSQTGYSYLVYCPELELKVPSVKQDQYLRIWYKPVTYTGDRVTNYVPKTNEVVLSGNFYKYGYRKSASTFTVEATLPNTILNNNMDSEVSVRYGLMWTLSWDSDAKLTGYAEGPIVALYRYKAASAQFLFNTKRQFAYNTNLLEAPTVYAKTVGSYIVLDGVYDMFMSNTDDSVFKVQVVFDQTFDIGANKQIVVGVKNAPNITLEYTLIDSSIITSSSGSRFVGFNWVAGKPYLMTCMGFIMSYTDPSLVVRRKITYRRLTSGGGISTTSTSTFNAEYRYDTSSKKFRCTPNVVYNLEGIEHYYTGSIWKTCIPAGTLMLAPTRTDSYFRGYCRCNGQSLSQTLYPSLFQFLGGTNNVFGYSSTAKTFNVPDYRNRYLKATTEAVTSTTGSNAWKGGSNSFKLVEANLPTFTIPKFSTESSATGAKFKEISITPKFSLNSLNTSTYQGYFTYSDIGTAVRYLASHYHLFGGHVSTNNTFYLNSLKASSASSYYKHSSVSAKSPYSIAIDSSVDGTVYAGMTSMPLWENSSTSSTKIYVAFPNKTISGTEVKITPTITKENNVSTDTHVHQIPAKTVSKDNTTVSINPAYALVATYIFWGESLVMDDDATTITVNNSGNLTSAPAISAELYSATVASF